MIAILLAMPIEPGTTVVFRHKQGLSWGVRRVSASEWVARRPNVRVAGSAADVAALIMGEEYHAG